MVEERDHLDGDSARGRVVGCGDVSPALSGEQPGRLRVPGTLCALVPAAVLVLRGLLVLHLVLKDGSYDIDEQLFMLSQSTVKVREIPFMPSRLLPPLFPTACAQGVFWR